MNVAFLDRDGIINEDYGYVHDVSNFHFKDGIFELTSILQKKGYSLIVCTNQSGIGRQYYNIEAFHYLNIWMIEAFRQKGVEILDTFYCPHLPSDNCVCRKPRPGLFNQAFEKYTIDQNNSVMIGDQYTDIIASHSAGIKNRFLVNENLGIKKMFPLASRLFENLREVIHFESGSE